MEFYQSNSYFVTVETMNALLVVMLRGNHQWLSLSSLPRMDSSLLELVLFSWEKPKELCQTIQLILLPCSSGSVVVNHSQSLQKNDDTNNQLSSMLDALLLCLDTFIGKGGLQTYGRYPTPVGGYGSRL